MRQTGTTTISQPIAITQRVRPDSPLSTSSTTARHRHQEHHAHKLYRCHGNDDGSSSSNDDDNEHHHHDNGDVMETRSNFLSGNSFDALNSTMEGLAVGSLPSSRRERRMLVSTGGHEAMYNGSSGSYGHGHLGQRPGRNGSGGGVSGAANMAHSMPIPSAPFLSSRRDREIGARLSSMPKMSPPESATESIEPSEGHETLEKARITRLLWLDRERTGVPHDDQSSIPNGDDMDDRNNGDGQDDDGAMEVPLLRSRNDMDVGDSEHGDEDSSSNSSKPCDILRQSLQWLVPQARPYAAPSTDNDGDGDGNECGWAKGWNAATFKYRRVILLATFLIWIPLGFYSLPQLLNSTDGTFHPVPGSPSETALIIFRNAYGYNAKHPDLNHTHAGLTEDDPLNPPIVIVLDQIPITHPSHNATHIHTHTDNANANATLIDGTSQLYNATKYFALGYEPYLLHQITSNFPTTTTPPTIRVDSYYSLHQQHLPTAARAMATPSGTTTLLIIATSVPPTIDADPIAKRRYLDLILDSLSSYAHLHLPSQIRIGYTGLNHLNRDMKEGVKRDLARVDSVVPPIALFLLALALRSGIWILVLPLLALAAAVSSWSMLLLLFANRVLQVTQITPTVVMSLTLGLGVDYSLFLLSRVTSDFRAFTSVSPSQPPGNLSPLQPPPQYLLQRAKYAAIESMIQNAGRAITVSGATLACTFLGLLLLPLHALRSIGVGASICIGSCILANLTLVPALLHTRFGTYLLNRPTATRNKRPWPTSFQSLAAEFRLWRRRSLHKFRGWETRMRTRSSGQSILCFTNDHDNADGTDDGGSYICFRDLMMDDSAVADFYGAGDGGATMADDPLLISPGETDPVHRDEHFNPFSPAPNATAPSTWMYDSCFSDVTSVKIHYHGHERHVHPMIRPDGGDGNLQGDQNDANARVDYSQKPSIWHRMSRHLLHPFRSFIILCGILVILLPIATKCTNLNSSMSFEMMLPSTSPALSTLRHLGKEFGEGVLSPYRVIFDGNRADKRVDTKEGFHVMQTVVQTLIQAERGNVTDDTNGDRIEFRLSLPDLEGNAIPHYQLDKVNSQERVSAEKWDMLYSNYLNQCKHDECLSIDNVSTSSTLSELGTNAESANSTSIKPITNYIGIAWANNKPISHAVLELARGCAIMFSFCPVEALHALSELDSRATTPNGMTSYITATLPVNSYSNDGVAWLKRSRDAIRTLELSGDLRNYTVALEGGASIEYDAKQVVYQSFPTMILLTLGTVFVLMGVFFQSVVTPLRSVCSISLTLGFVFGFMVLVYQDGILNWTGIPSLQATGEVSWLVPIMAFSIVVGLGLDYDVFLISRILEFRMQGYTHRSSVMAGLHHTGTIITAAGVIMAVSFGGLMLSNSPVLFQWSFLLTVAVLLDTFVIRTIVVPILMGYTGNYSWWPKKLPLKRISLFQRTFDEGEDSSLEEAAAS